MNQTTPAPLKRLMLLIPVCFFLSGLTGLVYEILWMRMIVKVIGSAPFAVSIILTIFMGGLGLGSYLASRKIDRISDPLDAVRIYGILELVIGGYSLALPLLISAFKPLFGLLYNGFFEHFLLYNLLTFVGCAILLIVPVICMGATLPILCRFYVTTLSHIGTRAGRLYGLNTIGAAGGSLVCGFWLIYHLGVQGTLITAVIANVGIGGICLFMAWWARARMAGVTFPGAAEPEAPETPQESAAPGVKTLSRSEIAEALPRSQVVGALIIFAVSGFCAMAYEVIWTKLLGLIVGPTTYSFTIVLVTFITGLALGSMFFGWLGDRVKNTYRLLIATQIAAAFFALGTSQVIGNGSLFFSKLIFTFRHDFLMLHLAKGAALFAFMILPTFCLGATFPLVSKICTRSLSRIGRSIGVAYSINTIGAVLGSFCAGFILVPLVGKETGLSIVVFLQLAASAVIVLVAFEPQKKMLIRRIAWAAPAALGLLLCLHYPHWSRELLAKGKYHRFHEIKVSLSRGWLDILFSSHLEAENPREEIVYYGDGVGGFTTVIKKPTPFGNFGYIMTNSGKADASSYGDMKTQTMSAHYPLLFHPDPEKVMILGLASGITAGEALCYPVDELDVVEISKQVVEASDFFLPWNSSVLTRRETNLIIQDARAHLEHTKQVYDVIVSEPSNPWMAGLASLFTRDFFALARERLTEDGIFAQFLHSYQMDWRTFSLVGRSFTDVFPDSILVATDPVAPEGDYLLIGFCGGPSGDKGLDLEQARKNIAFTKKSKNVKLTDPRLAYRLIVSEDLGELFGPGPVNTDSRPLLEFQAPKLLYNKDPTIRRNLARRSRLSPGTREIVAEVVADIEAQIAFTEFALSVHIPYPNFVNLAVASPEQRDRFFRIMEDYCRGNVVPFSFFTNEELVQRCSQVQIDAITAGLDEMPDKALSLAYLANLYLVQGKLDTAIKRFEEALILDPDNVEIHSNLGAVLFRLKRHEEALAKFNRAAEIKPDSPLAHYNLGKSYFNLGRYIKAAECFAESLRLEPENDVARIQLGATLIYLGKHDEAVEVFEEGLRYDPENTGLLGNLAIALAQQGKYEEALAWFEQGLSVAPDDPMLNSKLGIMLIQMDLNERAVAHLARAVALEPTDAQARVYLSQALCALHRFDDAVEVMRQGVSLAPGNAEMHFALGKALARSRHLEEAESAFEEALRVRPLYIEARNHLQQVRAEIEKLQDS